MFRLGRAVAGHVNGRDRISVCESSRVGSSRLRRVERRSEAADPPAVFGARPPGRCWVLKIPLLCRGFSSRTPATAVKEWVVDSMSASEDYSASGTDSEEPQRAESETDTSASESGSEDTETRFMVMKNDANKRAREDETKDTASKKAKPGTPGRVTSPPPGGAVGRDEQLKAGNSRTPAAKIAVKKPSEPPGNKKPGQQRQPDAKQVEALNKARDEATPKKTPQAWTNEDEQVLISHILRDMRTGIRPPKRGARGDNYHYWGDLHDSCQGKFIADWSKEQLYDKYRRMKTRFDSMVEKEREEGPSSLKFKNSGEEKLFQIWKQIYDMQEQDDSEPPTHPPPRSVELKKVVSRSPVAAAVPVAAEEAVKRDFGSSSAKKNKQAVEGRQNGRAEGNYTTTNSTSNTNSSMAALQEIQNKSNAQLEEIQGKVNQMMSEFQARSQRLVQEARNAGGRVEMLGDWLMMSMSRANSPLLGLEMPSLLNGGLGSGVLGWLGGLWDGGSPAATKFKEHWLKQQAEELRVMEQRLRLLQELCVHQQEMLKQSQPS